MAPAPPTLPLRSEGPLGPVTAAAADRLPGFDRVRAGAMLLVVLFHAALPYACGELTGLLWTVPVAGADYGTVADPLFWTAEATVMALFFGMSGFFSARAAAARSAGAFVAGRVRRVAVPLAVGVCTIVTASLGIWFFALPLTGRMSWEDAARLDLPRRYNDLLWGTSHLWYLQYLFLWALLQVPLDAVAAAADRGENAPAARLLGRLDRIVAGPWRWAVPTVGLLAVLGTEPDVYLGFQHGWFPHTEKFLHAGVCFLFGWLCWRNRAALTGAGSFPVLAPAAVAAAVAVPLVLLTREAKLGDGSDRTPALLAAVCAGLALTAALTYGVRSVRPAGRWTAKLAAASFWVYLVHQPVVGATQLGLWFADWPADAKFAAVAAVALTVSLLTEPLSRRTRLGRLLTGLPPAAPAPAPAAPLRRAA